MTFIPDKNLYDAFGRLRTSGTGQRLDVEFLYTKQRDFFDETTSNGTVTYNGNTRDLTLSLSDANSGSHATMRSHPVPYTPGNSQLIDMTGVLDLTNIGGGNAEVFLRTKVTGSVAEEVILQSAWIDKTTGVNWQFSQLFSIDFQSLKVGVIRFFLYDQGVQKHVASIHNENVRGSGYWQLPSHGTYWRIYNTASDTYMELGYGDEDNAVGFRYKISADATATMKAMCSTVKSEGGSDLSNMDGVRRSIDNGITTTSISTTLIPILSIRPRSTFLTFPNKVITLPQSFAVTTDNPIRLVMLHNCTLTGASWANVDTNESSIEFDVSASALTGGHSVYTDYVATLKNKEAKGQGLLGKTVLWDRQSSETGIFTIAAVRTGGSNASVLTALRWTELI